MARTNSCLDVLTALFVHEEQDGQRDAGTPELKLGPLEEELERVRQENSRLANQLKRLERRLLEELRQEGSLTGAENPASPAVLANADGVSAPAKPQEGPQTATFGLDRFRQGGEGSIGAGNTTNSAVLAHADGLPAPAKPQEGPQTATFGLDAPPGLGFLGRVPPSAARMEVPPKR